MKKKIDAAAWLDLLHDDFEFTFLSRDDVMKKSDMIVEMMANAMQNETVTNRRCIYENDDICVVHQFSEFASGKKEAIMVVSLKKTDWYDKLRQGQRHSSDHLRSIAWRTPVAQPFSQAT